MAKSKAKAPAVPAQTVLGIYRLAHLNVEVICKNHDTGGEFYFAPDDKGIPRIKIGIAEERFAEVLEVLLHEAMEFVLCMNGHRYYPSGCPTGGGDTYIFSFNHSEFTIAVAHAAQFSAKVLPALRKHWQNNQKLLKSNEHGN